MSSRIGAWFITVLAIVGIVSTQVVFDRATPEYRATLRQTIRDTKDPLIPTLPVLKFVSMNDQPFIADWLWLQAVQYFGDASPKSEKGLWPSLGKILNTVSELDSRFAYPERFALVVTPALGQADLAVQIGERGIAANPQDGLMAYYLAATYHLNLKDYKKAAFYYDLAATLPDSPTAAKSLAGVVRNQISDSVSDRLAAASFWEAVYKNSNSELEKERAARWYGHMLMIYEIEKAAETYRADHGTYPSTIQTMAETGYLPGTPKSPMDFTIEYHNQTGRISWD